ncbi:adhesion G protein-coupled receptor E5-like [Genypterus blacodes]|uniref:adhesion G protein-coupled receptor E5-like n=1 Tax=Genypterus blacodes TaxID=154954 RepID=UPI003F75CEE5
MFSRQEVASAMKNWVLLPILGVLFTPVTAVFPADHQVCKTDSCGPNADCLDGGGCHCGNGYDNPFYYSESDVEQESSPDSYGCLDRDECQYAEYYCDPKSICGNTDGGFICTCVKGYIATDPALPTLLSNPCIDKDECLEDACGVGGMCYNEIGSYFCFCHMGYGEILEPSPFCQDIDECLTGPICVPDSICYNTPGDYVCECKLGYESIYPNQPVNETNICLDIDECLQDPPICGPDSACNNTFGAYNCSCNIGYVLLNPDVISSDENPCTGIQEILDEIVPAEGLTKEMAFLIKLETELKENPEVILPEATVANCFSTSMAVSGVGPQARSKNRASTGGDAGMGGIILGLSETLVMAMMEPTENQSNKAIHTPTVGSAAAAFLALPGLEELLSKEFFKTENQSEMYSDVMTAVVPGKGHTNLSEPVNFTIQHKKRASNSSLPTCVYWDDKGKDAQRGKDEDAVGWSVDGCWVAYSEENFTICSCSHLSTFALIMQIGEPPPDNPFIEWLNRMCVMVGLFFFALAVLTFLLCSWNPKINNTARLHLCLSLGLSHLLLLWNDKYVENELACTVMAGVLHFLVVASFVWMLLEAVQLYLLVRRLSKVQVIQRDGLPRPLLYLVGYGIPFVIVGVSALIYSDGYGAVNEKVLIVFKIVAQFIILGCTWILGFYQTNIFFQVLFIILNSQQGTFLFIVHCLLNKEGQYVPTMVVSPPAWLCILRSRLVEELAEGSCLCCCTIDSQLVSHIKASQ